MVGRGLLARAVAAVVIGAGLAAVPPAGAPAGAVAPSCEEHVVRVSETATGTHLGYLGDLATFGGSTGRYSKRVDDIADAIRVRTAGAQLLEVVHLAGRDWRFLGLSAAIYTDEDGTLGTSGQQRAFMTYLPATEVGAVPQNLAYAHSKAASAIWTVAPGTGKIGVRWVNPNGKVAPGVRLYQYSGQAYPEPWFAATAVPAGPSSGSETTTDVDFHLQEACEQAVTLTAPTTGWVGGSATLAGTGGASGNPVTFSSATPAVCTVTGTVVTYRAAGTCTVVASQAGSGPWLPGTARQDIAVSQDVSTAALTVTPATSSYGEELRATMTVSARSAVPTGSVSFALDGEVIGTEPLRDGTATLDFTPDLPGSQQLTATFASSVATVPDARATTGLVVDELAADVRLVLDAASAPAGVAVVPSVTVDYARLEPAGSVQFRLDGADVGAPVALVDGAATGPRLLGSVGVHTVSAHVTSTVTGHADGQASVPLTVVARTPVLDLALSPATTVTGQATTATLQVGDDLFEPTGTVQFALDGVDLGAPVALHAGAAVSPPIVAAPGTHVVSARLVSGRDEIADATTSTALLVSPATTAVDLTVTPRRLQATVTTALPGTGTPSGTVVFRVDGAVVGRADLVGGVARLPQVLRGGDRAVSAEYAGDGAFLPASASTARRDPVIRARLSSPAPRGQAGWYRRPVTVRFTCTPTSGALATPCPAPVTVTRQTGGRTISRTVRAVDGGVATASVRVALDRTAPRVRLAGVRRGATYLARPQARCVAGDGLSGVASCRVTTTRTGDRVLVRATARDRAGNTRTARASYRLSDVVISGASYRDGAWQVTKGRTYPVLARSGSQPVYVYAAPAGRAPHGSRIGFSRAGAGTWVLPVGMTMATGYSRDWRLGVVLDGTLREVRVRVHG